MIFLRRCWPAHALPPLCSSPPPLPPMPALDSCSSGRQQPEAIELELVDGSAPLNDVCKTPPRSGSGASCGRPVSRDLQRLWMGDHEPELEQSVSQVNHALDDFLCHERVICEARDGDDAKVLSALHPVQRHVSSEGL